MKIRQASRDYLLSLVDDILEDKFVVWWCDGIDLTSDKALKIAQHTYENWWDVAGVVMTRRWLGRAAAGFIHIHDKHVIVIEVETARVDRKRGQV